MVNYSSVGYLLSYLTELLLQRGFKLVFLSLITYIECSCNHRYHSVVAIWAVPVVKLCSKMHSSFDRLSVCVSTDLVKSCVFPMFLSVYIREFNALARKAISSECFFFLFFSRDLLREI